MLVAPDRSDVAHEACERHLSEAEVMRHALEAGALQTIAVKRDRQRPFAPAPARQNAQQKILSLLLRVQTTNAGEPQFAPIVGPVRARLPRNEKRVADHLRARQRKSELLLGQPAAVFGDE